jgi:Cellulose binding domain
VYFSFSIKQQLISIQTNMSSKNNNRISKISVILILISVLSGFSGSIISAQAYANSIFNNFTYGVSVEQESIPNGVNLVAGPWVLNDWQPYNSSWLNKFNYTENSTKTPYLYLYVAAGKARADWGLQDCNVGAETSKTLCYNGANYIRSQKESIKQAYINTANQIKILYGSQKEIVLHVEPDFYQYASSTQSSGGLTATEAAQSMNQWTSSIKSILPNASLVMDVSPWNSDLQGWSAGFQNFDYAGMVGKRFSPYGDGSVPNGIDGKTYAQIAAQTGKKIIVDNSHGAGGWWLPFDYDWANQSAVNARRSDGVVAVILPPNDNNTLVNLVKASSPTIIQSSSSSSPVSSISSITSSSQSSVSISSPITNSSSQSSIVSSTNITPKIFAQNNIAQAPITDNKIIITTSSLAPISSSSDIVKSSSSSVLSSSSVIINSSSSTNSISSTSTSRSNISSVAAINPNSKTCTKKSLDVTLTKTDSWQNGFNTSVKVKNTGTSDIYYWNIILSPTSDQNIVSSWNLTRYGNQFDPKYSWNMTIRPGQEINAGGFTTQYNNDSSISEVICNF